MKALSYFQLIVSVICIVLVACKNDQSVRSDEILTEIDVDLTDSLVRKIFNYQDRMMTDSVVRYFSHRNPTYRYLAALTFASIHDETHLDTLATLLKDPVRKVRQAAAYGLGQLADQRAEKFLIECFQNPDSTGANNELNETILEAIGKCGDPQSLPLLSQVTTYGNADNHLLLGQARAIFRFMLRSHIHEDGTQRMVNLVANPDLDEQIRLIAAHYLARADVDLTDHSDVLSLTYSNLDSGEIKILMPLIVAKCQTKECQDALSASVDPERDFREQCNGLRAMARSNFRQYRLLIQKSLYSRNILVAGTAADMILEFGDPAYWRTYMNLSLSNFPWQVKTTLLHAVSRFIPPGNSMFKKMNNDFIQQRIGNASNVYEMAAGLAAVAEDPGNYRFIINRKEESDDFVVKTTCTKALADMVLSKGFARLRESSRKEIVDHLAQTLISGDVGMVAEAIKVLDIDLPSYGHDMEVLIQQAKESLQLPRDIEAYNALQHKFAELKGTTFSPLDDLQFTHPIDWKSLDEMGSGYEAVIETNKGAFRISLLPQDAPGTVANFVDLANLNYYAGKPIHRVVAGFVIQGGCNRGDGYGSLDYNIRSELPQKYYDGPGYIGMASAGNHTESAQWFVTQGATPHLDGRYTIFGRVSKGLDVVNNMEVGDTIQRVTIP
ncbi:MAG: hypothetical protein HKN76_18350 [Saprospiraceae bacterium]|nr:hypothetical protein [Saprospiraceae bacterium]